MWSGAVEVELSAKEFALLELFMRNPGVVLSRDQLLDGAWDMSFERRSNVIDVYVALPPQQARPRRDRDRAGMGYRLSVAE